MGLMVVCCGARSVAQAQLMLCSERQEGKRNKPCGGRGNEGDDISESGSNKTVHSCC